MLTPIHPSALREDRGIAASVIAMTTPPGGGPVLTTLHLRFPRLILAEVSRHRVFSFNSESSRAIPVAKLTARDLYIPVELRAEKRGMAGGEIVPWAVGSWARYAIDLMGRYVVGQVVALSRAGVHKQHANRYLEPWMWHEILLTGFRFNNFFRQRLEPTVQPEIRILAEVMLEAMRAARPHARESRVHMPMLTPEEDAAMRAEVIDEKAFHRSAWIRRSCARLARISFSNHDGTPPSQEKDEALYNSLRSMHHMSPFEHPRYWVDDAWHSHRESIPGESGEDGTYWSA